MVEKIKFLYSQVIGLLLFFSVLIIIYFLPFEIPNKFLIAIIIGFIFYSIAELLIAPPKSWKLFQACRKDLAFLILFTAFYLFTLFITFIPTPSASLPYLSFNGLGFIDVLKIFAAIALTSLLPGYVVLSMILFAFKERAFSKIGRLVLSVLFSFFITSIITLLFWTVCGNFEGLTNVLIIFNALLLSCNVIFHFKNKINQGKELIIDIKSVYLFMIFCGLFALFTWVFCSTHLLPNTIHVFDDEYYNVGITLQMIKGWQPWQTAAGNSFSDPFGLYLIFIATAAISNVAVINVVISFFFIYILPCLAFYFMVELVFEKHELSSIATVIFTLFSGLGWVYANFVQNNLQTPLNNSLILQASQKTYDIVYSNWFPIYISSLIIELSGFFIILGMMKSSKVNRKTTAFMVIILSALCVLFHSEKMIELSFLIFFVSLLYVLKIAKFISYPLTFLSSIIFGLLIAMGLGFLAPQKVTPDLQSSISYSLLISIASFTIITIYYIFENNAKLSRIYLIIQKLCDKRLFIYFIIFVYFVLCIALVYSIPSYDFDITTVPLWFLPVKFGVAGILFLFGLVAVRARRDMSLSFFIALLTGSFLMQLILYHLPFGFGITPVQEFRFIRDILWPFLSVIAAFGLQEIITRIQGLQFSKTLFKLFTVLLVIVLVVIAVIPSNLLKVQYFADGQTAISPDEIDALNYLSTIKIPSGSYLLTVYPKGELYAVTGTPSYDLSTPIYSQYIFNSSSSGTTLSAIKYLNISYVFLSTVDIKLLESSFNNCFFTWLIPKLSIIYSNDNYTILSIPDFSAPSTKAGSGLITGDLLQYNSVNSQNFLWSDQEFSSMWENFVCGGVTSFNLVNGSDPSLTAQTIQNQQAAVFYRAIPQQPILTSSSTFAVLKFKSNTAASYVILEIGFTDGDSQRITLNNNGYMKSNDWTVVTSSLEANRTISSINIGITDNKEGNGNSISVSLGFVAIGEITAFKDYYDLALFTSLLKPNYESISQFDTISNYNTIFLPDLHYSPTILTKYIDWTKQGGTLIVVNFKSNGGGFSDFLNFSTNGQVIASSISDGDITLDIPLSSIPQLTPSASSLTMASYEFGNESVSPFILQQELAEGRLIYIQGMPALSGNMNNGEPSIVNFIRGTIDNYVNNDLFDLSNYAREFYAKNIGAVDTNGVMVANSSCVIFDQGVVLNELNVIFTGSTKNESYYNISMSDIVINNKLPIRIESYGEATIKPLDSQNHVLISITGNISMDFDLLEGDSITLTIKNGDGKGNGEIKFGEGTLRLYNISATNLEFIAQNPSITTQGSTNFDSLTASYPLALDANQESTVFSGNFSFEIKLSQGQAILFNNIAHTGSANLNSVLRSNQDFNFFECYPIETIFFSLLFLLAIIIYTKMRTNG